MLVFDSKTNQNVDIPYDTFRLYPDRYKTLNQQGSQMTSLSQNATGVTPPNTFTPPPIPTDYSGMTHVVTASAYAGAMAEIIDGIANYALHVDIPSAFAVALGVVLTPVASLILRKIG